MAQGLKAAASEWEAFSALACVERSLDNVLENEAYLTAALDARIQNALNILRRENHQTDGVRRLEKISAILFTIMHARLDGRSNLYRSQILRLARLRGSHH